MDFPQCINTHELFTLTSITDSDGGSPPYYPYKLKTLCRIVMPVTRWHDCIRLRFRKNSCIPGRGPLPRECTTTFVFSISHLTGYIYL